MAKILVDISAHGFGHLSQALPVVDALATRRPDLEFVIRCGHPRAVVATRCPQPFTYIQEAADVGQVMVDATTPDLGATLAAYQRVHADWPRAVDDAARRLDAIAPDLLLADVPYLGLAAAARSGIRTVAMCSLNWADVLRAYFPDQDTLFGQMIDAYHTAAPFIRVSPHMPMGSLSNTVSVGPIARRGSARRGALNRALGLGEGDIAVLVTLGGIPTTLPIDSWPRVPGLHFIVDREVPPRPDVHRLAETGLDFHDVLASVDALVAKLGYGLSVEAALAGRPLLFVRRGHFPDEPSILDWLRGRIPAREITAERLHRGDIDSPLRALLEMPSGHGAKATGAQEAAAVVLAQL